MKPENFITWLKGYIQLNGNKPDARQWQIIQDHLALVFDKKTPDRSLNQVSKEPTYCSTNKFPYPSFKLSLLSGSGIDSKLDNGGSGRLLFEPNLYSPALVELQNLGFISGDTKPSLNNQLIKINPETIHYSC
jgi:hypothetical protein